MQSLPQHIQRRGMMYIRGVGLLIERFSATKKFDDTKKRFLYSDLNEIEKRFSEMMQTSTDKSSAQYYLDELLKSLCEFIETEFLIPKDQSFETLCEAEKFAHWHTKRQDLVTISTCRHLQIEQNEQYLSLLAHQQKEELDRLARKDFPIWYKQLPEWQRIDLSRHFAERDINATLEERMLSIPNSLRTVPGLAHFSRHTLTIRTAQGDATEYQRFAAATPSPIQVNDKNERLRLTKLNLLQLCETPFRMMGERSLAFWKPTIQPGQLLNFPILIQSLLSPIWVDGVINLFSNRYNESRCVNEKEAAVQLIREKFASHRGVIEIRLNGTLHRLNPVLISTNHAINFLRQESLLIVEKKRHNDQEGAQLIRCAIEFIQTVILPKLHAASKNGQKGYHEQLMDLFIRQVLQRFIKRDSLLLRLTNIIPFLNSDSKQFHQLTNMSMNAFNISQVKTTQKDVESLKTSTSPSEAIYFKKILGEKFKQAMNISVNAFNLQHLNEAMPKEIEVLKAAMTPAQIHRFKLLLNATKEYVVLSNTARQWVRHKEMFSSSLEEIITECLGGVSFSSSLWNRDRKALQTLHTDAMLVYYEQYGLLPIYRDNATNRRRFIEIFADLFMTEHQQKHAGMNAPGSEGLHRIEMLPFSSKMDMLPSDIIREIKRRRRDILKENAERARLALPLNPNHWITSLIRSVQYNWSNIQQFFSAASEN